MAKYVPIAKGDQDQVKAEWWVRDDYDIPNGTICRLEVHCGPLAYLFDIAGAEQTIGQFLAPGDAEVIDCYGEDGVGYVEYRAVGVVWWVVVLAVMAALALLGITAFTIVSAIQVSRVSPTMFSWQLWLIVIAIIAAIVVMIILVARSGRVRAGPVQVGK